MPLSRAPPSRKRREPRLDRHLPQRRLGRNLDSHHHRRQARGPHRRWRPADAAPRPEERRQSDRGEHGVVGFDRRWQDLGGLQRGAWRRGLPERLDQPGQPGHHDARGDQGAVVTLNGGQTWSSWYNQPTAQLYHVAADNAFPYRVCSGQQESGSVCISSRATTAPSRIATGCPWGGRVRLRRARPSQPDIVYGGRSVTRFDRRTGQVSSVGPGGGRGANAAPGPVRTVRTMAVVFSAVDKRALFFANNYLWKTVDGGTNWKRISPDLTRATWEAPKSIGKYLGDPAAKPQQRGVIYTIAPSYQDVNRIWVGTDDGLIQVTADGGLTWKDVTPPAIGAWAKVSVIDAGRFSPLTAYAAVNTLRLDDLRPHIFRTDDGGKTWSEIVTGIPNGETVNAVREDQAQGTVVRGDGSVRCTCPLTMAGAGSRSA